jgi:hypothetical protein
LEARFVVSNFDGGVEVGISGVSVERCFIFVWATHASDEPFRVVPAFDPGEDRQFGVMSAGPAVPIEQLGLQAPEERLSHRIVMAVDRSCGRGDAGIGEALMGFPS